MINVQSHDGAGGASSFLQDTTRIASKKISLFILKKVEVNNAVNI